MATVRTCEYCGGNVASGCGPTSDGRTHYSKIDCAEFLKAKLAQIESAVCLNCKGSGEFGLADGEVPCWVCGGSGDPTKPGVFYRSGDYRK